MPTYFKYIASTSCHDSSVNFEVKDGGIGEDPKIVQCEEYFVFFGLFRRWKIINFWCSAIHTRIEGIEGVDDNGNGCIKIAKLDGFPETKEFCICEYAEPFAAEVKRKLID